ncbi:MYG1 family protein [Candidatus Saccharibacteria bacterium]|nr:MYG1 family protein [Candidatus Saccharibacteria bacterium]
MGILRQEAMEKINAITHPAPHHADETFATAMLQFLFPEVNLVRTRDPEMIDSAKNAIIYDVGGVFDPEKKRFDHHQRDFAEVRPDGTKYSSAGLIWREYGVDIVFAVGGSKVIDAGMANEVVDRVDRNLVKGIDARDNGQGEEIGAMSVSAAISVFNPLWDENEDDDACFAFAVNVASMILEREIKYEISSVHGCRLTEEAIEASDGPIMVMDRFIGGWLEAVLTSDSPKAADLLYAVFQGKDGNWDVQAIPPSLENRTGQRKPFPEEWRGLRGGKSSQEFRVSEVPSSAMWQGSSLWRRRKTMRLRLQTKQPSIPPNFIKKRSEQSGRF